MNTSDVFQLGVGLAGILYTLKMMFDYLKVRDSKKHGIKEEESDDSIIIQIALLKQEVSELRRRIEGLEGKQDTSLALIIKLLERLGEHNT